MSSPLSTQKKVPLHRLTSIHVSWSWNALKRANVWQFLDELHVKCEELATVGVKIDEKDYWSTICISSLTTPFTNFTSNQLAFAKIYSPTKSIIPDLLIFLISKEYKQNSEELSRIIWSKCSSFVNVDLDLEATIPDECAAHIGASNTNHTSCQNLWFQMF